MSKCYATKKSLLLPFTKLFVNNEDHDVTFNTCASMDLIGSKPNFNNHYFPLELASLGIIPKEINLRNDWIETNRMSTI